jgi:alkylation response protein AidB-like acyl-CoA dehydrogenase
MSDATKLREDSRTTGPLDVVDAARDLQSVFDRHGAENDEAGHLVPAVLDAVHASGITSGMVPRDLGGSEATPTELLEMNSTMAYGDPSTGWVTMAYIFLNGLAAAFLDRDLAAELLTTDRLAIAGQGTKAGVAERSGDGYRLSGRWFFGSGVKHATHIHTAAADSETGEVRFFLVPRDQVTFLENWDVLGLRATGSIDYVLDDVYMPREFSYPALSTSPVTGGPLYHAGIGNYASINHGAWAIGIGRRILDELVTVVGARAGSPGALAGNASFHEQFGSAELRLRSARALLFEIWGEIEEAMYTAGDETMPMRLQTLNRMALVNATRAAVDVAEFAYRSGGSEALRRSTLQRLFRDVHGGMQHISSSPLILQSAGRQLAGLAEGQTWVHFELR